MKEKSKTSFVPMLAIPAGTMDISFYNKAFGAVELRRWSNDDGTVHVAEFEIAGALFHLHEEKIAKGVLSPKTNNAVTTTIGLMVDEVDNLINQALAAGATLYSPATDYEYGYRQGEIIDPFGHRWLIEKMI